MSGSLQRTLFAALTAICVLTPVTGPVFAQQSPEPPALVATANRLRATGRFEEADRVFREALTRDERNVDALLGFAELSRSRLEYGEALSFLDRAEKAAENSPKNVAEVLFSRGNFFLTIEEPEKAAECFRKLDKSEKGNVRAAIGLANVAIFEQHFETAEDLLQRVFERSPENPAAFVAFAKLCIELNRAAEAKTAAEKAVQLAPDDPEALSILCSVRVIERNPEAVRKLAERVLQLNPYNSRIRRVFSQYIYTRKAMPVCTAAARQEFEAARVSLVGEDFDGAKRHYQTAVERFPAFTQALVGLGATALRTGDCRLALEAARRTVTLDPENSLGQLQFSLACTERHVLECRALGSAGGKDAARLRPFPLPNEIRDVFPDFDRLTDEEQTVLAAAVGPFAHFLSKLKQNGARHYILGLDRQLADIPGYGGLADRKTFDGRFYGSLRGVGGVATVTGIEALTTAARGGFNTVAHEFAHQVHNSALDASTRSRIETLFWQAKKEKRFLDYYAAANEWEYFAQGYEAYVSVVKRPNAGVTGRHTRDELKRLDPDLFDLFEELSNPDSQLARIPAKR